MRYNKQKTRKEVEKMEIMAKAKVTLETIEEFSEILNETMVNQCGCTDTYCGGCPGM